MEKISRIFLIISHFSQTFFANFRFFLDICCLFPEISQGLHAHPEKDWGTPRLLLVSKWIHSSVTNITIELTPKESGFRDPHEI